MSEEKPRTLRYNPAKHYTNAIIKYELYGMFVSVIIQKIGDDNFYSFRIGKKAYNRMLINLFDSRLTDNSSLLE